MQRKAQTLTESTKQTSSEKPILCHLVKKLPEFYGT